MDSTENLKRTNDASLQKINEDIYKRNLELSIVNKTLSLLRKLYQISLLALKPEPLSEKISDSVLVDLNMELAGMFLFDEENDKLVPLNFSKSKRFAEVSNKIDSKFLSQTIEEVSSLGFLNNIVIGKSRILNGQLWDVWGSVAAQNELHKISSESHIQTMLVYPLVVHKKSIGVLIFGMNRDYHTLNNHEQESINSLIDVVAVAMDNALLYQKLEATNKQLVVLDKARAEFITIASHQLRTPPATIKWYLSAILGGDFGKVPAPIKTAIDKANITNNGQISLIDDMLNVSRIERGKMEFIFEPTNIQKIAEEVIVALTPQAVVKKLKLEYKKPRVKIVPITADQEKIKQVINNIIDNAIKYTKKGTVKLELTQNSKEILIRIRDTGKGLQKGEENRIFDKFSRSKDSVKHASGLGLGLYVAKIVVEHHKGKIWAESAGVDKGTSFLVSLPIKNDLKAETFDLTKDQE